MWNLISVHLEEVLVSTQEGARFVLNVPWAWTSFWAHPMVLLANVGQEEARFNPFGDSINLVAR